MLTKLFSFKLSAFLYLMKAGDTKEANIHLFAVS